MATISLDFNEVRDLSNNINNKVTSYNEKVSNSLRNDFQGLKALGLFTEGFNTINQNLKDMVDANNSLTSAITSHVNNDEEMENDIADYIKRKEEECKLNINHSTGRVNVTSDYSNITVNEVNKGIPIKAATLTKAIPTFSDEHKKILLESINTNKGSTSLSSLLLDKDKSGELYKITKISLGDMRSSVSKMEGTEELQKTLVENVVSNINSVLQKNNENSMIVSLPYLSKYAEELDTNLVDLLYSSNREVDLMNGLCDLYNGINVEKYNFNSQNLDSFKNFIDKLASDNNVTSEKLLRDSNYLNIIKRGV